MRRKSVLFSLLFILAFAGYFLVRGSGEDVANSSSSGTEVIAFGDSLVAGIGSERGGGFVRMLAEDFLVPITNLGKSGDTTADGLARLHQVTDREPKIVILLLGGNDFLRDVPTEETFRNLETIIKAIQDDGSAVILLGVRNGLYGDDNEQRFRSLARQYNTGYVSDVLEGIMGDPRLMSDNLHPNDVGYRIIADRVGFVLSGLLN